MAAGTALVTAAGMAWWVVHVCGGQEAEHRWPAPRVQLQRQPPRTYRTPYAKILHPPQVAAPVRNQVFKPTSLWGHFRVPATAGRQARAVHANISQLLRYIPTPLFLKV